MFIICLNLLNNNLKSSSRRMYIDMIDHTLGEQLWWDMTPPRADPILQTLVQVDWEPGPTEIVPNWAPLPILQTLVQVDWEPGLTEIVPNWAPRLLRLALTPPSKERDVAPW